MLGGPNVLINAERVFLRLPRGGDYVQWREIRENGTTFLSQWEPTRQTDYLSRRSFRQRGALVGAGHERRPVHAAVCVSS